MMTSAKMKSELMALALYSLEAAAATAWAMAFDTFFQDAVTNGVPVAPGSTALAKADMQSGLVGMSTTGAASIAAGISAYWAKVATLAPSIWAGTTAATPPPALAGLQASLESVFATNILESASKDTCMGRIADAIFAACTGGLATWPLPIGPLPIL